MRSKIGYNDQELGLNEALNAALSLIDVKRGPIIDVFRNPRYNDEPLLYQYTAVVAKNPEFFIDRDDDGDVQVERHFQETEL